LNKSKIPYLKLDLNLPQEEFYNDILSIKGKSVGQQGNESWRGTVLHGLASDKPRPASFYGYKDEDDAPYTWTESVKNAQFTKKWIEDNIPFKKLYRVKMNLLKSGGEIGPHVDGKKHILGVSDSTSPENVTYITLAIEWPEDVIFNVDKYRMPIKTGDVYLINFSQLHEVYNHTDLDRYSIIVMCDLGKVNMEWQSLILRSYEKYGQDYKTNKASLGFLLKSRLINRPKYLLNRIKSKLTKQ
jgi:hypothetical protein